MKASNPRVLLPLKRKAGRDEQDIFLPNNLNVVYQLQYISPDYKTTNKESLATKARTDFNLLSLKTANRETNIFTVWDSGLVYQHQNILESVKQGETVSGKSGFVQKEKKENIATKTQPPGLWMYAGTAVLLIGAIWIYRKLSLR